MTPQRQTPTLGRGLKEKPVDMGGAGAHAGVASHSGCDFTTHPAGSVNSGRNQSYIATDLAARGALVRGRVSSVPLRKANGLALPMGCPSLTSRGRRLTGGVEVLIRASNDDGRVGRRYGTRMKSMATDPYLSLPSLRVPVQGGSKEAACLMAKGELPHELV